MTHQRVLVVDFGGQYTQLIVRRVREFGVYSEMVPWTEAARRIAAERPEAVILSGGPRSVREEGAPDLDFAVLEGIPVLGICYGQQLMAHRLGGTRGAGGPQGVRPARDRALHRPTERGGPGREGGDLCPERVARLRPA